MEVAAVTNKPGYNSTKKGAAVGAGVGVAVVGYQNAMVKANYMGLKSASDAVKRDRIRTLQSLFKSSEIDMAKTTVSKVVKCAKKAVLNPSNLVKQIGGLALIGAGIGVVFDLYKNSKSKSV